MQKKKRRKKEIDLVVEQRFKGLVKNKNNLYVGSAKFGEYQIEKIRWWYGIMR